jgi:hypothetical protein
MYVKIFSKPENAAVKAGLFPELFILAMLVTRPCRMFPVKRSLLVVA